MNLFLQEQENMAAGFDASAAAAVSLVPPRPNPGPEPLEGSHGLISGLAVAKLTFVASIGLIALIGMWWRWRLRRRAEVDSSEPDDDFGGELRSDRERMIAYSRQVRRVLTSRFGTGWAAKTTEEIAAAGELGDWLRPEQAQELVRFLHEADRYKYQLGDDVTRTDGVYIAEDARISAPADGDASQSPVDAWGAWVETFLAEAAAAAPTDSRPAPAATATSRIIGK